MVVTDSFRQSLKEWLAKPGNSTRKLGKLIGCDASNFSRLINKPEDYKTSELVLPISRATGIPLPEGISDPSDADLLDQLRKLRTADRASFDAIVALIKARTP
jgi:hypothetical protein